MSAVSYLLCSADAKAPGPGPLGRGNYDYRVEIIASGPNHGLAAFWLTLFDRSHLKHYESERERIPTLVAPRDAALRLLGEREQWLFDHFVGCRPFWNTWSHFVRSQTGAFFKVDASQLYWVSGEYFEQQLGAATRWFESRAPEDFAELLMLSRLVYDPVDPRICFDGQDHVDEDQLCGFFGIE